jgi:type VI secretion system secreted protein Hcp
VDGFDGLAGAETAALFLTANGQPVAGDSTVTSLGRQDSIECLSFRMGAASAASTSSGLATGRRRYDPLVIRKRTDRASPLLWQAFAQNQVVAGELRFFRPNPSGDGTTQHFFTVRFDQARITQVRHALPMVLLPDSAPTPLLDEVSFTAQTYRWTFVAGGIEFEDSISSALR